MKIKILETTQTLVVTLNDMKNFARIDHNEDDYLLEGLIKTATAWVENATDKSLLHKTLMCTQANSAMVLPRAPIIEIINVKIGGKELKPTQYEVTNHHTTLKVTAHAMYQGGQMSVTYRAGFGQTSREIPETLKQAVMSTVLYMYENRYDLPQKTSIVHPMSTWIHQHRTYQMA